MGFTARRRSLLWWLFNQNLFRIVGDDDRDDISRCPDRPAASQPVVDNGLKYADVESY
jgi:hypothetical protein